MAAGRDRHLELFLPLGSMLGVPRITLRFGDSLAGLREFGRVRLRASLLQQCSEDTQLDLKGKGHRRSPEESTCGLS